ncbi:hypothetical protein WJX73_010873 [Symbiochloris irregularis]|uniref:Uncharacterized protein n=1 Tax=Symbiochloris irregularis TaxID=706552 RepID=A0AAW1PJ96_9CHLO
MKSSLFSKLGLGGSTVKRSGPSPEEIAAQFAAAADLLKKIRAGARSDFPALNEATRLVQSLDGIVTAMPNGEIKSLSHEQVSELQQELQLATEQLISREDVRAPRQSSAVEGSRQQQVQTTGHAAPAPDPMASDMGDMFSGLSIAGDETEETQQPTQAAPATPVAIPVTDTKLDPPGPTSQPLPEDLFSGLDDLTPIPASDHSALITDQLSPDALLGTGGSPQTIALRDPDPQPEPIAASPASRRSAESTSPRPSFASSAASQPAGRKKRAATKRIGYDRTEADEMLALGNTVPLTDILPQIRAEHEKAAAAKRAAAAAKAASQMPVTTQPGNFEYTRSPSPPHTRSPIAQSLPHGSSPAHSPTQVPSVLQDTFLLPAQQHSPDALMQPGQHFSPKPSFDPDTLIQGMADADVAQIVEALHKAAEAALARAAEEQGTSQQAEKTARAKRRSLLHEVADTNRAIEDLVKQEASAVETEDFETAANLSSRLDAFKHSLTASQRALQACEDGCARLAERRAESVQSQADIWHRAAAALVQLQSRHSAGAERVNSDAEQAAKQAAQLQAAARERVEELTLHISKRQRWLDEETASVQSKVAEAQAPVAAEREARAEACAAASARVTALRAELAEQEAVLADAESALADSDAAMAAASSRYSKILVRLSEDGKSLAADVAERDEEERVAQQAAEEGARRQAEAAKSRQHHEHQAQEAASAASAFTQRAGQLAGRMGAQAQARALQDRLRSEQTSAEAQLQAAQQALKAAQAVSKETAAKAKSCAAEAGSAEEQAGAARRQIAGLEADKKAAAAAREFKEAARLAAQVKACAAEAESCDARAAQARQGAQAAQQEQQAQEVAVAEQHGSIATAQRAVALAQWRRLQAQGKETERALEAALASEDFEEAEALQEELDSAQQQGSALADAHGFTQSADFPEGAEQLRSTAASGTETSAMNEHHEAKALNAADFDMPLSSFNDAASTATLPAHTSMQATDGSESVRSALTGYSEGFGQEPRLSAADGDLVLAAASVLSTPAGSATGDLAGDFMGSLQNSRTTSGISQGAASTAGAFRSHASREGLDASDARREGMLSQGEPGYLADSDSTAHTQAIDLDDAAPPGTYARGGPLLKGGPSSTGRHADGSVANRSSNGNAAEGLPAAAESPAAAEVAPGHARIVKFAGEDSRTPGDADPPSPSSSTAQAQRPLTAHAQRPSLTSSTLAMQGSLAGSEYSESSLHPSSGIGGAMGYDSDMTSMKGSVAESQGVFMENTGPSETASAAPSDLDSQAAGYQALQLNGLIPESDHRGNGSLDHRDSNAEIQTNDYDRDGSSVQESAPAAADADMILPLCFSCRAFLVNCWAFSGAAGGLSPADGYSSPPVWLASASDLKSRKTHNNCRVDAESYSSRTMR